MEQVSQEITCEAYEDLDFACPDDFIDYLINEVEEYGMCSAPGVEAESFPHEYCSQLEYSEAYSD